MEYLFIYGLQLADLLNVVSGVCGFILIATTIALIPLFMYKEEDKLVKDGFNIVCKVNITLLVIVILSVLAPTKQTLLLMGGTYYGKKAVNAVVTSDKLQKVSTIIDLQLDKYIKDLTKEVNHDRL
jgi:hypothetical protein